MTTPDNARGDYGPAAYGPPDPDRIRRALPLEDRQVLALERIADALDTNTGGGSLLGVLTDIAIALEVK